MENESGFAVQVGSGSPLPQAAAPARATATAPCSLVLGVGQLLGGEPIKRCPGGQNKQVS